jgi:pimeloyl-ACP methyl ester carboxylesterase
VRNFRQLPALGAIALLLLCSCGPPARQVIDANAILPNPPPSAPLSHWTATPIRIPVSQSASTATLRGWTFQALPQPRKLRVLFFNGNAMTIDDAQSLYRSLCLRGADVTAFDYRGYGFSTGKSDMMAFRRDALTLYDLLASSGPVVVYGFSMGTAMAVYVASQRNVAGLILAGTISTAQEEFPVFARAQGFSDTQIANMDPSQDAVTAFNERSLIAHSNAPLLMLHGEADQLVPIQQGREVFAASPAKQKLFVSIPGATHNETVESPSALQSVGSFLASIKPRNEAPNHV